MQQEHKTEERVISTTTQKKHKTITSSDCKSDINMISNVSRPIEMNLYIVTYVSFF
jgi:phosphoserine phosphatase